MSDSGPLLGAYAAKQCPVRLFRRYDPTEIAVASEPDEDLQQLFDDGIAFESQVVAEIMALHDADQVVVIPGRHELDHGLRREMTQAALARATPIICGALMEPDLDSRRVGEIDVLVATGRTISGSGRPEYRAIDVKSHRCTTDLAARDDGVPDGGGGHVTDLSLIEATPCVAKEPRYREDDCLQLAHYHRLLQANGHAEPDDTAHPVHGGILGSERLVAWFDLQRPQWSTVTPQLRRGDDGETIGYHRRHRSTKRTTLDRYDFEFAFRLQVVDAAERRTDQSDPPIVEPVKVAECGNCEWRDVCDADLRTRDDVSLVRSVGYPEWRVHRFMGIDTCTRLSELDPDEAVVRYADTPLTEGAVRTQINEARSAVAGTPIVQPTWDPSSIPRGDLEIDLDMENADHVYLWGARLSKVPADWGETPGAYVPFASFEPLDETAERELATGLWNWLAALIDRAEAENRTWRVYFYSPVETTMLRRLVSSERLEIITSSDGWVDLLPLMRQKFWSNWGHGLKVTATASGFAWRDDAPSGYASTRWYGDAIAGVDVATNIDRILVYNEDDCRATATLRDPVS